jgi:DNA-binding CsgD family transcriptional regulator
MNYDVVLGRLTKRELELVALLALGKTQGEAGTALGITQKGVSSRMACARRHTGCATTYEMMFRLGQMSVRGRGE